VRARLIAVVIAATGLTAGCTSSGPAAGPTAPAPLTSAASTPGPAPSTAPTTAAAPATPTPSVTPSSRPAPTTPTAASTPVAAGQRECSTADLSVRVRRGGAAANEEIALITFTNTARTACSLTGFPGVSLRRAQALLGAPATRSGRAPAVVVLAPGASAGTTLTDVSTCQADLSDTVRVYPPDSTAFVDQPLTLRGCALYVDPVTPA
jgi:hypothetical protein